MLVNTAKALLLDKGINSSTQIGIIREFDAHFVDTAEVVLPESFNEFVLKINKNEPTEDFAITYLNQATDFYKAMAAKRGAEVNS